MLFYRRMRDDAAPLGSLESEAAALTIGGLVRDLRQAAALDSAANASVAQPKWAVPQPLSEGSEPPHDAEALAARVRRELGLGQEPIASVWALARSCGVRCAAVTPEVLDRSIDGLSWRQDRPGIVVNLIGGAAEWWRTRMTVAHELAHVWFDHAALGLVISAERGSGPLYDHVEAMEQRANAFAAYLLVPAERVREMARARPVDTQLIEAVSREYGVGFTTTVHTVCNALGLSVPDRMRLLTNRVPTFEGADHPDAQVPDAPREQLRKAVGRALREGRLDSVRARTVLGLRMRDPLPPGLPDEGPVLGTLQRVRNAALRHLRDQGLHDVVPDRVELLADGSYRVTLVEARYGAERQVPAGEIVIPASAAA